MHSAYSKWAARCDDDACDVDGFRFGLATRPLRWVRALLPKKRPLRKLSLCEGGTFKVRRDGEERKMVFLVDQNAPDTCSIDMM